MYVAGVVVADCSEGRGEGAEGGSRKGTTMSLGRHRAAGAARQSCLPEPALSASATVVEPFNSSMPERCINSARSSSGLRNPRLLG